MKEGDKLYCHTDYVIKFNPFEIALRAGRVYSVDKILDMIWVKSSVTYIGNTPHSVSFSFDNTSSWYYKNYFYTEQEMRKKKLEKLNKI